MGGERNVGIHKLWGGDEPGAGGYKMEAAAAASLLIDKNARVCQARDSWWGC